MSHPALKLILVYNSDPFAENIGGVRRKMRFLASQATENQAQVKFVGVRMGDKLKDEGIEFIPLFRADSLTASNQWWRYMLASMFRVPFLRLEPQEIIHAGRLLFLLPYCIWHPRNPKVCSSDTPQAVAALNYPSGIFRVMSGIYKYVEHFIVKRTDAILAAPQVLNDYFLARYPHFEDRFMFEIDAATGVDVQVFQPRCKQKVREELGFGLTEKLVIFVGRVHPVKGIDFLIDAFSLYSQQVKNSRFLLVGEDWAEGHFQEYARRYPESNIEFAGDKQGLELAKIYNCADLLVVGSVHEGFPQVVREAICSGIPVVSTDVGDVSRQLTDSRMGEVLPDRDPQKFAEAMYRVSNIDPQDSRQACLAAVPKLTEEANFQRIYQLYLDLLRKRGLVSMELDGY